jgi:hypothetical protein
MSERNDGGPTFPVQSATNDGVTLRDYFAAKAPEPPAQWWDNSPFVDEIEGIICWRWYYADAMLAEREK